MKIKKIPLRSCVITKERLPKKDLLRIVRTPSGSVEIDLTGKMNGHGAYIKKDKDVVLKAKNNKALEKHLEIKIDDSFYDKIIEVVGDKSERE